MLNKKLNLNPKVFDKDVEKVPIRKGFGQGLLIAGERSDKVFALCADLTESTQMHLFRDKFPDRFVEIGIAEQNLASVASGISAMGNVAVASSFAVFSPGRNWEQIRTTICYNDCHVVMVGSHAGLTVGEDGGTHQALEDLAITRVLPNMIVISPCDAIEAKKAIIEAVECGKPTYIRIFRPATALITTEKTPFKIGKSQILYEKIAKNKKALHIGIIATGELVHNALVGAKIAENDMSVTVMNLATIKPLDKTGILALAKKCDGIVTVEDHQVAGGMGSAVAEYLSEVYPTQIKYVGVKDKYGQSGAMDELLKKYGLDAPSIARVIKSFKNKK